MGEQEYDIKQNILFQDNRIKMKMGVNGKRSCTGNSRPINIRYFFAKDRVEINNVSIAYFSTEHMIANLFTKALQGALFETFR